MFTYPRADNLDEPDKLADLTGSFWTELFPDHAEVRSLLGALGVGERDSADRFDLLQASMSRDILPLYRTPDWQAITLLESAMQIEEGTYVWTLDASLVALPTLFNRVAAPSLSWIQNIDYSFAAGTLVLRQNPFTLTTLTPEDVVTAGVVTDHAVTLWAYRAAIDESLTYTQYGYAWQLQLPTSRTYRDLIRAMYAAAARGSNRTALAQAFSALADVPLAVQDDTVAAVFVDASHLWVCTTNNAYAFNPSATALVAAGDTIRAGQALADPLRVVEIGNGQIPTGLAQLTIPVELLGPGYLGGLTFKDETVPWVITTVQGFTKMSFDISGLSADVTKFWHDVHARGIEYQLTLAHLLDTRPHHVLYPDHDSFADLVSFSESEVTLPSEPTAAALPQTVNPLQFLLANILRNNTFLVLVKPSLYGPEALSIDWDLALRPIVPPHTLAFVVDVG